MKKMLAAYFIVDFGNKVVDVNFAFRRPLSTNFTLLIQIMYSVVLLMSIACTCQCVNNIITLLLQVLGLSQEGFSLCSFADFKILCSNYDVYSTRMCMPVIFTHTA